MSDEGFVAFPLLAEPGGYAACIWDLGANAEKRAYWLGLFRKQFPSLLEEAAKEAVSRGERPEEYRAKLEAAHRHFFEYLAAVEREPNRFGRLDIIRICWERERALRAAGIDDPYRVAKHRENRAAMALLPALIRELDALPDAERSPRLVQDVFAGNIFDLGVLQTIGMFKDKAFDFRGTLERLKARPWAVDDLDAWLGRLERGPAYRSAVLFVDNAGPDVLLGMIPLARELLRRGAEVLLTANTCPSLNDVTIEELTELVREIAGFDGVIREALAGGRLELVESGNDAPLIDLMRVSPRLAEAVRRRKPDLLVLEGMGRAIESNWLARFTVDTIKIAMIKDIGVADAMGWSLYDLVFRYEPGQDRP